jgi:hypothetical protein
MRRDEPAEPVVRSSKAAKRARLPGHSLSAYTFRVSSTAELTVRRDGPTIALEGTLGRENFRRVLATLAEATPLMAAF